MGNRSLSVVCTLYATCFVYCTPKERIINEKLRSEIYQNRVSFEQNHQTAFSSSPEEYRTWAEVLDDTNSQCRVLTAKIFPKKDMSVVTGKIGEIKLTYRRIRDQDGKPFPLIRLNALSCGFPKRNYLRTWSYFIKSPNSSCAFFLNSLSNRPTTYYITEEICEYRRYPRFWIIQYLIGESEPRKPYYTDTIEEQGRHEIEHREDYLQNPVVYRTWPELDQKDEKIYCHKLMEEFLSSTIIDITQVESERGVVTLSYSRITDEKGYFYKYRQVNALKCAAKHDPKMCFHFVRAPKTNCVLMVRKRPSSEQGFRIARMLCDEGEEAVETSRSEVRLEPFEETGGESSRGETTEYDDIFNGLSPIENLEMEPVEGSDDYWVSERIEEYNVINELGPIEKL